MNRRTRKQLLNLVTGVAVTAAAVVVFLPAAQAAPGTATNNVNVRSGPGTGYAVVDALRRGDRVDVQRCQGSWCYVVKPGPDGWVSANYLSAGGRPVDADRPGISFGFSVPGGPSISIGVGNDGRPTVIRPRPPQRDAEVCFYEDRGMRGSSFCLEEGERTTLRRGEYIGSIDNPDGLSVQLCTDRSYRECRTYTTSANSLGRFGDLVTSVRVR
ncbi:SH3 domain-containing protein [Devosia sp. PTR5]|uniref:SH3 domain-containing protein n=1 Tax=Devosia oryzisoli TaxID=2774138 RepID=A0A927FPQ9_9HYPH|nr:SH3 domain-containing protein [Devosia oryzisoli]MBD8063995.1 SH3 domain-containing protein [Devosia oryzisoli]